MSDSPGPGRFRAPGLLVLSALLAVAAWVLMRQATYSLHAVEWSCDGEGCSTDDPRIMLLLGGIATGVVLVYAGWSILRGLSFGIALSVCAFAAVDGWRAATADGLQSASDYSGWTIASTVLAWIGVAVTVLALRYELKMSGLIPRLLGRPCAPARLSDFEVVDDIGTALLSFTDSEGFACSARVNATRDWLELPVRALYVRDDPTRTRLVLPWYRPSGTPDPDPDDSVVERLERLAALHNRGELSDTEYERAKARILGSH
ncbi:SHOCT domain-containing protein [Nocardia sp. NPDC058058]|uniref:SHOCT domain-containing protein n=1 Tax=Nocardia sp. NPDC058058 TaxID=3346317 RepID=UPI0036DC82DA